METYYDEIDGDVMVLVVDGGLNAGTSEELAERIERLVDAGLEKLIIDCSRLTMINSSGLSVLVRIHKRMKIHDGDVKISGLKGLLPQVLQLTRLDSIFELYPDVDRGAAGVSAAGWQLRQHLRGNIDLDAGGPRLPGSQPDSGSVPDFDWIHSRVYNRLMSLGAKTLLQQHGVYVTAQRIAVIQAVSERPHCTADDVAEEVRGRLGAVSRQAVYDALRVLVEKGLIRRIQPAHSAARYEDRVDDNHHHLVCRTCGRMVDVDCAIGAAPCLKAADDAGYEIDEAEVIYWGRCPECLAGSTDHGAHGADDHDTDRATARDQTDVSRGQES